MHYISGIGANDIEYLEETHFNPEMYAQVN
jgi:hypothetical protein